MSKRTHRQPKPCSKKGPRFVFRGRRCLVAVQVGQEIGPCEVNRRVWRPNNWQRVQKDLNGEE